ncbi:MAG: DNA polymerase III subunit beta [Gammaproteobacteria bacterium]|nr:DNA polymerase III subunit beta [Gammaproteobacteria bacterium]MDE0364692.1 DNA polymerase III subunit beta [Gammaproteobacteria bacterium]
MKFSADRELLLRPLQLATGVVERRQTLPILANLHIQAKSDGQLTLTATDLEVELVVRLDSATVEQEGEATIPARKLADIWRALPESAVVSIDVREERAVIRSGRSRFSLAVLPPADFPRVESGDEELQVSLGSGDMRRLVDKVSFSMAQQDVRYYLNGMLLEVTTDHLRAVATDGHRLAMCTLETGVSGAERLQVIVPRKGVHEIARLLDEAGEEVRLSVSENHMRVGHGAYTLTSRLIDGKFPDYEKVIPADVTRTIVGDRDTLKVAFQRASILSNEKYRGVRLVVDGEQLTVRANNPEQEEAEEIVEVSYDGEPMEIGFNVGYLQDVLNALPSENVRLGVSDGNNSALIEASNDDLASYVVMPMRL